MARSRVVRGVLAASALALVASAGALAPFEVGAQSPSLDPKAGEQGIDDGSTLTMWSRAATESRLTSQVNAYNATHQNQIQLRFVPTDDYVGVVGNAATANELPDLFSADV